MNSDKDLLLVSLLTFLTVLLWVSFELIKTIKTTTVATATQRLVIPLSPAIDLPTIQSIKERKTYSLR